MTRKAEMRSMLAEPEPCTVIEEVGSTGVGAMALAFIILLVSSAIFLSKAWNNSEHKRFDPSLKSHFESGL